MLQQMEPIGLSDTPINRLIVEEHLQNVVRNPNNIVRNQGERQTRESLLMGPNGGVKLQTVWENDKLITINVFGR